MKRIVLVIELDVPERISTATVAATARDHLHNWAPYITAFDPLEDNAPIRLNISYYGVEEL